MHELATGVAIVREEEFIVVDAAEVPAAFFGNQRVVKANAIALRVDVQAAAPDVALTLTEMVSMDQIAALCAGRIDVGLLRPMVREPALSTVSLMREPYVVALASSHRLAGADAIDPALLAGERFLMTPAPKRRYLVSRLAPLFRDHGFVPTIAQ